MSYIIHRLDRIIYIHRENLSDALRDWAVSLNSGLDYSLAGIEQGIEYEVSAQPIAGAKLAELESYNGCSMAFSGGEVVYRMPTNIPLTFCGDWIHRLFNCIPSKIYYKPLYD